MVYLLALRNTLNREFSMKKGLIALIFIRDILFVRKWADACVALNLV